MNVDIAIVGAGPAGLCVARSLADTGLSVLVIEQQSQDVLREPPFDGREIALTPRSVRILRDLGIWQRLGPADISPLRSARVLNGSVGHGLHVTPYRQDDTELGFLVPNDRIRRAAYASVEHEPRITLACGTSVESAVLNDSIAQLHLSNGNEVNAKLVIAADSRFSRLRRDAGIAADMHDFGKTMLVCRMALEKPHGDEALEWFGHAQTLALLPLRNGEASTVVTLPPEDMRRLMDMNDNSFNAEMGRRFNHRFGAMRLISTRHAYPLVGVYARRFAAQRFALIGDAAVGMHPVTAHGFNLGLRSVDTLASLIQQAVKNGRDIASPDLLLRYQRMHRCATWPMYAATMTIVTVYTDDRPVARRVRAALLQASQTLAPVRQAIARTLASGGHSVFSPSRHRG
ncbi:MULTISPECIES: 5-demethoxyubiquinol-8 5-hydroxylase UbiM [unclassified Dyella]|uniref:5-demethoxyubiquinol-8 5-hydroxylase UbiM n=1 Tax=unclassified Dyella TaxID=2634549 RepID=UPI000C81EDB1|nr:MULTISPECIES: 5-demethoxyubiquinol-8 5-hydroxylase UbiM [unclassified Dyella]MDR3447200.1 5-demethoxyubiquinol-8 5-hydroxylase UbiM [Dyella sp.]PMQ06617.1 2-octaprenylphenol hydroxylase [Dyella sp. AD56]